MASPAIIPTTLRTRAEQRTGALRKAAPAGAGRGHHLNEDETGVTSPPTVYVAEALS
jgi:hypothetical protein